jgi:hypothetical protein
MCGHAPHHGVYVIAPRVHKIGICLNMNEDKNVPGFVRRVSSPKSLIFLVCEGWCHAEPLIPEQCMSLRVHASSYVQAPTESLFLHKVRGIRCGSIIEYTRPLALLLNQDIVV